MNLFFDDLGRTYNKNINEAFERDEISVYPHVKNSINKLIKSKRELEADLRECGLDKVGHVEDALIELNSVCNKMIRLLNSPDIESDNPYRLS